MNEDHLPAVGEDQVGRAGQIASMEPIAIAEPMRYAPHGHFRTCVLLPDAPHARAQEVFALIHFPARHELH
ncbi:MAG: hypothetical protein AB7U35_10670 [Sphingobium sp.]